MTSRQPLLRIDTGPDSGTEFELGPSGMVLGRDPGPFSLRDPQVSRLHAQVRVDHSGGMELSDLGSRNGTWLNGKKVLGPTVVVDGDVIRVGSTQLVVVAPTVSAATQAHAVPAQPSPAEVPSVAAAPALAVPSTPQPFNAGLRTASSIGGAAATRQPVAMALTFATIIATAIALVLYFALR